MGRVPRVSGGMRSCQHLACSPGKLSLVLCPLDLSGKTVWFKATKSGVTYYSGERKHAALKHSRFVHIQKNWCFWTVVLEKTLESPLDCKEIQPVHSKGNQSWMFIGRTDVEAETPILLPLDAKSWLIWKHPDAGKDWGQEEKGMTEDEMVGWHHQLNGHAFG